MKRNYHIHLTKFDFPPYRGRAPPNHIYMKLKELHKIKEERANKL